MICVAANVVVLVIVSPAGIVVPVPRHPENASMPCLQRRPTARSDAACFLQDNADCDGPRSDVGGGGAYTEPLALPLQAVAWVCSQRGIGAYSRCRAIGFRIPRPPQDEPRLRWGILLCLTDERELQTIRTDCMAHRRGLSNPSSCGGRLGF